MPELPDQKKRKKTWLLVGGAALLLIVLSLMIYSLLRPAGPEDTRMTFKDVDLQDGDYAAIVALVGYGLMDVSDDGNFAPDQAVSRSQLAILVRQVFSLSGNRPLQPSFADVLPDRPDYASVEACRVLFGYPAEIGQTFGPDEAVTRQTAAEVLARALDLEPSALYLAAYLGLSDDDPVIQDGKQPLTRKDAARLLSAVIDKRLPTPGASLAIDGIR